MRSPTPFDAGRVPRKVDHDPDREHRVPCSGQRSHREARHRHHPYFVHRCRPGGQFRPSRYANGTCTGDVLGLEKLRFDPDHPIWSDRDRFVLSAGHASTLLYSTLHLAGVKSVNPQYEVLGELAVPLEDLKKFRQLDSKCPGHPEYRWTAGIECTTGPLGTGIATSVGMAMAGLWQAATFNRPGYDLFNYNVYAIAVTAA